MRIPGSASILSHLVFTTILLRAIAHRHGNWGSWGLNSLSCYTVIFGAGIWIQATWSLGFSFNSSANHQVDGFYFMHNTALLKISPKAPSLPPPFLTRISVCRQDCRVYCRKRSPSVLVLAGVFLRVFPSGWEALPCGRCPCFHMEGWSSLPPTTAVTAFPGDSIILWGAVYFRYVQKLIFVLNVYLDGRVVETSCEEKKKKLI